MTYRNKTIEKLYEGYNLIQKYKALRRKEIEAKEGKNGLSEVQA